MAYVGVVHEGMAMFFNARPGHLIEDTVCAAVMWSGDKRIVQRGVSYRMAEMGTPQGRKALKARADKMAQKWNAYQRRTGKRYEIEEDKKRAKKDAKRKAEREAALHLREKAPELLAMLKRLAKAVRFEDVGEIREVAEEATALINTLN